MEGLRPERVDRKAAHHQQLDPPGERKQVRCLGAQPVQGLLVLVGLGFVGHHWPTFWVQIAGIVALRGRVYSAAEVVMSDHESRLQVLYLATGLRTEAGPTCAAESCACAATCWAGVQFERRPPPLPALRGQAYRPWIGEHYANTRLVLVGESFNDHGGWNSAEKIVEWVIPKLAAGVKRMNFDAPGYRGSLFQHRAATYAGIWLAALGHGRIPIGELYRHVAFTNQVKCVPRTTATQPSRPTKAMWAACGQHVLAGELAAMEARRILVLGTSANAGGIRQNVWTDLRSVRRDGAVELLRAPDGREALVVPHPAARGGAAHAIADQVRAVLVS